MYEQHFGLKKRLFRANASGNDVFVGPQTATILAGLKKALTNGDAIAAVSGPVGSGKTTLVNRALESLGSSNKIVRLARMHLDSKDVLEYLLDELGVADRPNGIIQMFAFFQRTLKELQDNNNRVFIAVEDASYLGAETLAELEALTAADAGNSEGASIVLMGDDGLEKLLLDARLMRVKQRIRHRFLVAPLCAAELRGYLRHCFRLAGGDFERLFDSNAAPLLHHLSGGVLRTTNNLIDSAMTAAHDQGHTKVSSELLARISENEFGLSAAGFDLTAIPLALPVLKPEPVSAPDDPLPTVTSVSSPAPAPVELPVVLPVVMSEPVAAVAVPKPVASVATPEPVAPVVPPEPVAEAPIIVFAESTTSEAFSPEDANESEEEIEVPEFIQDTLPDLEVLAPALAAVKDEPELFTKEKIAEPGNSEPKVTEPGIAEPKIAAESSGDDVPAWDRDPTVAELRPDIAALEAALAFSKSSDPEPAAADRESAPTPQPKIPDVIPEITLDYAISQRFANCLIDEPGEISAPAKTKTTEAQTGHKESPYNPPRRSPGKADAELEKIAVELAKAKSLEDVDDRMAETLFGDEINFVAAQFVTNLPATFSENENIDAVSEEHSAPDNDESPAYEVTLEATRKLDDSGMDLSASQRLKTVRALNADLHPSLREIKPTAEMPTSTPVTKPQPIEDQINTSMTQTLKALNVRPPVNDDDIDDEDSRRGFFSRFKRP